jgi:hypothetical protein
MFGETSEIDPAIARRAQALPFGPAGSGPSTGVALPELAEAHARFGGTTEIDPDMVRRAVMAFGSGAGAPSVPVTPGERASEPALAVTEPSKVPVAPPPMIGPLATPEMVAAADRPPPAPADPPPALMPVVEVLAAPAESPLPLSTHPLERCAAIAASVARRRAEKGAILERHQLTEEVWSRLEEHWAGAIERELGRGKSAMLNAFDTAYVAQLEAERGIVTVEEYAQLAVAAERRTENEVLAPNAPATFRAFRTDFRRFGQYRPCV